MDFRHVRALIAVAEEASISRAAVRLHVSQPPLSRLIRQLEDELGTRLFLRHRHGVTLTDGGKRVLDKARTLTVAADEFLAAAADPPPREDVNRLRIGIGWGLWESVNRVRVRQTKRSPDVTIEARDIHCLDDYIDLLKKRKLDVVFARPPFDLEILETTVLFQERLFVMLSEDSPCVAQVDSTARAGERPAVVVGSTAHAVRVRQDHRIVRSRAGRPDDDSHARRRAERSRRHDAGRVGPGCVHLHRNPDDEPGLCKRRCAGACQRSHCHHRHQRRVAPRRGVTDRERFSRMRLADFPAGGADRRQHAARIVAIERAQGLRLRDGFFEP